MASREEEKRRRREERIAAEQAAQQRDARARRMRSLAAAVGGVAVLAVAGVLLVGTSQNASDQSSASSAGGEFLDVAAPEPSTDDLDVAIKAAGCRLREDRERASEHTTDPVEYADNPPTSGPHDPVPADDGAYAPGNVPEVEPTVHALEHGRINVQFAPGTPAERIGQLKSVLDEQDGYHVLLYENQTAMPYAVAATAWTRALTCDEVNDRTFDAIRAFRARFTDQAPEYVP